jgi:hypothetical protein
MMDRRFSVGDVLEFLGEPFTLLPRLEVVFGQYPDNEPPIMVSTLDEAYRVIRQRYPNACTKRWDEEGDEADGGFMFGLCEDYKTGVITLSFYVEPTDIVHEAFGNGRFPNWKGTEAGVIEWYMMTTAQFPKVSV